MLEREAVKEGKPLPEPVVRPIDPHATARSDWRELFRGLYLKRTLMIWVMWITVYVVNNGLVTWLPTLYSQVFNGGDLCAPSGSSPSNVSDAPRSGTALRDSTSAS